MSIGFPKQENWSGLSFPPSGDLSDPGIEPTSALQAVSLLLSHQKAHLSYIYIYIYIYTHTHTHTHTYNLILIMPLWGRYYFYYTLFVYFIIPFVYEVRKLSAWLKEAKLESVCLMTKHMLSKTPWCLPTKTTICRQYFKSWKFFLFFFLKSWKLIGHRKWYSLRRDKRSQKRNFKEVNISKVNWGSWHMQKDWPSGQNSF